MSQVKKIKFLNKKEKTALHDFFEEEEGVLYGPDVPEVLNIHMKEIKEKIYFF